MNPIHHCFKRYRPETIFHLEIKGHNSDNNRWILSVIEIDLYFMLIYLCMKYESNTPMYSTDIAWKSFFVRTGLDLRDVRTYVCTDKGDAICPPPIINGGGIKKYKKNTYLQKMHFSPKNWEPTEKNMA